MITFQEENWQGAYGDEYTERNPKTIEELDALYQKNYGLSRTVLNNEFLKGFDKGVKILEIGCNVGAQLQGLEKIGFQNLYGIDINKTALEKAKRFNVVFGSVLDIPFKDNFFDLVFTSGVLIHVAPKDITTAMEEIVRCSKQYIWGFEYFSKNTEQVLYRGKENLLWKADFAKIYLDNFDLEMVKQKKVKYLKDDNIDAMFFLKKK